MDYENLMKSMDAGAEDKMGELVRNAQKMAGEIRSQALTKAAEIKKLHMDGASKAAMLERNKSLYAANGEARKRIGSLKHELYDEAFALATERLAPARNNGDYADTFWKLTEEAVRAIGDSEVILHVDERDADLCRKVAGGLGVRCEVVGDNACLGGLIATTRDGKVVVRNTLEARLENARRRLRLEIFGMLYGGPG